MLRACEQAVASNTVSRIVELGCGWGGLTRELANRFPDTPVVALELSTVPLLWARARLARTQSTVSIERSDLTHFAPSPGDLLIAYLSGPHMKRLESRLCEVTDSLRPVWLVSSTFALPLTPPVSTLRVPDIYGSPVYLYCVRGGIAV
jgi:trans-aconitate methyltransferase